MKKTVEYLQKKHLIFKSLKEISPKELGSRKKLRLYLGVNLKSYYSVVIVVEKKSRVVQKEATELMLIHEKLEQYAQSKITKKYMIIKAPLCSKAKVLLEENGWKVWQEDV